MWIRDFLPMNYPNARIFTFGYDIENVWFSKELMNVGEVAKHLLTRLEIDLDNVSPRAQTNDSTTYQ